MNSLHSRRLSATTDINYGQLELNNPSSIPDMSEAIQPPKKNSWLYSITHPTADTLVIMFCIGGWYVFSLAISLYNKWMFDKSSLNLPFPILITSFHQFILSWISFFVLWLVPSLRQGELVSAAFKMDRRLYLFSIVPCGVASSGDIGFGNVSFRFITLTLYTMIKSLSIAFVLIFGVLFQLERLTPKLVGIVSVMIIGVVMMVAGSTNPSENLHSNSDTILGSFLVLTSSCMSGLRWALTQLVLKSNPYVTNPISTIFYLAPVSFVALLFAGIAIESLPELLRNDIWTQKGLFVTTLLFTIPGVLVFFLTMFEYKLLQKSHVITLSIAGIFKELLTIVVSSMVFGDKITYINGLGLLITLVDIIWYNYYRFNEQEDLLEYQAVDLQLDDIED